METFGQAHAGQRERESMIAILKEKNISTPYSTLQNIYAGSFFLQEAIPS